jgi:hypothetical protein
VTAAPGLVEQTEEHLIQAENAHRNGAHQTRLLELGLAKVKVQLAAIEQQRIANLIALEQRVPWTNERGEITFVPLRDAMPNDTVNQIRSELGAHD